MTRFSTILLTCSAFSAAIGQLLFKIGAAGREQWVDFINVPIVAGLFFYAASTLIWIYALSYEKLVNVYAFTALTFVFVYLGGVFIVHEKISAAAVVGVVFVLAGLYLITANNT